jgi:hypothetical protein
MSDPRPAETGAAWRGWRFGLGARAGLYIGAPSAAMGVLAAVGAAPWWPTVATAVALPPLDLFHDLRLLLSATPGRAEFAAGLAIVLVARAALLAWLLSGLFRRPVREALGFTARFYGLALVPMTIAAIAAYAAGATLFYLLFWVGLGLAAVTFVLLAPAPWQLSLRVWRGGAGMITAVAYLGLLAVVSAVADVNVALGLAASAALTLGAVAVLVTGRFLVARGVVAGLAGVTTALLVWTVASGPAEPEYDIAFDAVPRQDGSLVIMSGIDSASGDGAIFEVHPRALGFSCGQTYYYSYAGPGDGAPQREAACPIRTGAPYEPIDTYRSPRQLTPWFVTQIERLPPPVTVVTHSQGVWVAHHAIAAGAVPAVDRVVYLGPFPDSWVRYPVGDERGAGRVGAAALDWLTGQPLVEAEFSAGAPLSRDVLSSDRAIDVIMRRPLPEGVQALSIPSTFDLPLMGDWRLINADDACPVPVIHPNLPYGAEAHQAVRDFLAGSEAGDCPWWRTATGPMLRTFGPVPSPG